MLTEVNVIEYMGLDDIRLTPSEEDYMHSDFPDGATSMGFAYTRGFRANKLYSLSFMDNGKLVGKVETPYPFRDSQIKDYEVVLEGTERISGVVIELITGSKNINPEFKIHRLSGYITTPI